MKKAFTSRAATAFCETAVGLVDAGVINTQAMSDYDQIFLAHARAADMKDPEAHPVR